MSSSYIRIQQSERVKQIDQRTQELVKELSDLYHEREQLIATLTETHETVCE